MTSLRDLQAAVLDALLSGVTPRAAALVAAPGAAADARLGIYANTLRANFRASLRSTFPVLRRLVGDAYFDAVAHTYHRSHPSTHGDLRHVGRAFADHLGGLHAADAYAYLADVARFEWVCEDALLAAEHGPLDLQALSAVEPADYDALRFRLHPSLRLFESQFPVLRIWHANVDPAREPEVIELAAGGDRIALSRRAGALQFLPSSGGEMAFLHALDGGANFATALAGTQGDPDFDAGAALRRFVAAQVIVDFRS